MPKLTSGMFITKEKVADLKAIQRPMRNQKECLSKRPLGPTANVGPKRRWMTRIEQVEGKKFLFSLYLDDLKS